ncbi:maltotransferase domain-containing protein, partial [Actinomadura sp. 3N508]|uniref:maltotransferase domain-containing protein n=1 Tax=Actinomadura sp. 3N508 TaxID=3375153 RepID=UPI0037A4FE77
MPGPAQVEDQLLKLPERFREDGADRETSYCLHATSRYAVRSEGATSGVACTGRRAKSPQRLGRSRSFPGIGTFWRFRTGRGCGMHVESWTSSETGIPRLGRIPILEVAPVVGCGRWPAKAVVGETVEVSATVFREGHERLG